MILKVLIKRALQQNLTPADRCRQEDIPTTPCQSIGPGPVFRHPLCRPAAFHGKIKCSSPYRPAPPFRILSSNARRITGSTIRGHHLPRKAAARFSKPGTMRRFLFSMPRKMASANFSGGMRFSSRELSGLYRRAWAVRVGPEKTVMTCISH